VLRPLYLFLQTCPKVAGMPDGAGGWVAREREWPRSSLASETRGQAAKMPLVAVCNTYRERTTVMPWKPWPGGRWITLFRSLANLNSARKVGVCRPCFPGCQRLRAGLFCSWQPCLPHLIARLRRLADWAWQDCQSRAVAHAHWCVCRIAPQVGQTSAAIFERSGQARPMPWSPSAARLLLTALNVAKDTLLINT